MVVTMFGLSIGHLLILTFIILLFKAKRLPELGHALGKGIGAFKKGLEGKDHEDPDVPPIDSPKTPGSGKYDPPGDR